MTRRVSIVMPVYEGGELLERALPPLLEEHGRRGGIDELILVDDSGRGLLAPWMLERFPASPARVVARETNGGFARALTSGVDAAAGELILSLNSDVVVRPGLLEPLIERVDDPRVFAAVPLILMNGDEERCESLVRLRLDGSGARLEQPSLNGEHSGAIRACVVPFAVGGAFLFSKQEFRELGGFDPIFEPFYLEDLDLCWRAWRRGRRVVLEPGSTVEHHHRGTIGRYVHERIVRAAIERNLLLFLWKHLDDPQRLAEHLQALLSRAVGAHLDDRREELVWLCLALEQLEPLLASRAAARAERGLSFEEVLRAATP